MTEQRQPIETEPVTPEAIETAVEVVLDAMGWLREVDPVLFVALYRRLGEGIEELVGFE